MRAERVRKGGGDWRKEREERGRGEGWEDCVGREGREEWGRK